MLSAFTCDAMSGHPLPTSALFLVGDHPWSVRVTYRPDTAQRCARAALVLLQQTLRPLGAGPGSATPPHLPA